MSNTINCQHCGVEIGLAKPGAAAAIVICNGCDRVAHHVIVECQKDFESLRQNPAVEMFSNGRLAAAAATYALYNVEEKPFKAFWRTYWPFEPEQFEPEPSRERNLIKALSYIVAELNNLEAQEESKPCDCKLGTTCPLCEREQKPPEIITTTAQ